MWKVWTIMLAVIMNFTSLVKVVKKYTSIMLIVNNAESKWLSNMPNINYWFNANHNFVNFYPLDRTYREGSIHPYTIRTKLTTIQDYTIKIIF